MQNTKNQAVSQQNGTRNSNLDPDQIYRDQETGVDLPRFTDSIRIEIPIESIYKRLLATFPTDYKHRETLSHAIIGSAVSVSNGGVGYIYNALAGFTNNVDFKVGDKMMCTVKERYERYDANLEGEDGTPLAELAETSGGGKPNWKYREIMIGACEVIEINLYSSLKLKVRFKSWGKYDERPVDKTMWVTMDTCEFIPVPEPEPTDSSKYRA